MSITAPIKCTNQECKVLLGHKDGDSVHLDLPKPAGNARTKGLMRPGGGLTLACPACGTLNMLSPSYNGQLLEKSR